MGGSLWIPAWKNVRRFETMQLLAHLSPHILLIETAKTSVFFFFKKGKGVVPYLALFRAQGRVSDFSNSRMVDSWVHLCTIHCTLQRNNKSLLVVSQYTNPQTCSKDAEHLARKQLVPLFKCLVTFGKPWIEPSTSCMWGRRSTVRLHCGKKMCVFFKMCAFSNMHVYFEN